jgi:hypothetical protein
MLAAAANLSTVLMQFLNADSQVGGFVDIASHVLPVCDSISEMLPSVERIPKANPAFRPAFQVPKQ